MNLKSVTEGILFVVGDEGITLKELSDTLDISEDEVKEILSNLRKDYESFKIKSYFCNSFLCGDCKRERFCTDF